MLILKLLKAELLDVISMLAVIDLAGSESLVDNDEVNTVGGLNTSNLLTVGQLIVGDVVGLGFFFGIGVRVLVVFVFILINCRFPILALIELHRGVIEFFCPFFAQILMHDIAGVMIGALSALIIAFGDLGLNTGILTILIDEIEEFFEGNALFKLCYDCIDICLCILVKYTVFTVKTVFGNCRMLLLRSIIFAGVLD